MPRFVCWFVDFFARVSYRFAKNDEEGSERAQFRDAKQYLFASVRTEQKSSLFFARIANPIPTTY